MSTEIPGGPGSSESKSESSVEDKEQKVQIIDVEGKECDSSIIEELYGDLRKKGKWSDSYEERKRGILYSNEECDVSVGKYDVDIHPGGSNAMLYYDGFYVSRKDGIGRYPKFKTV